LGIMIYLGYLYSVILLSLNITTWPLADKEGLLSSFGEWRDGHLHAGVDFPTKKIGEEVYSVSDGWVMKVNTSPWGYGKVVYVRSWSGEIYVYAHLSSFSKSLEKIVRKEQLRILSYAVEIWFKKGEISVKEGEIIGYTGRSGCFDPHLHFELRDRWNNPMDPLERGFSVPDTIPPVIEALRLVPLDESSTISGLHTGKIFESPKDTISAFIEGKAGIEIETVDKVSNRSGRLGPKEIKLYRNRQLIRREFADKFSYTNYKDSRFLFDFVYRMRTGRKFRRLFAEPGNNLPFYEGQSGIISGGNDAKYLIEVYDGARNVTRLSINLLGSPGKGVADSSDLYDKKTQFETNGFSSGGEWFDLKKLGEVLKSGDSILIWNFSKSYFRKLKSPDGKCQITLPPNEKINTSLLAVKVDYAEPGTWKWEPPIPFKEKAKIKIYVLEEEKFCSIYEKNGKSWEHLSSTREGNSLVSSITHLGTFGILKDTVAPLVFLKRKSFSSKIPLEIKVHDPLSGVDFSSIRTFIDGRQTVFNYEPQRKRLIFEYPEEIEKGRHSLKLTLSDKQGNKTSGTWEIVKK
jgi:murein DD-endopeptidase MepM/ murein hydrolase activator NlpD